MTSSPNDEEVASSKKHTQFKIKTRVHKPYPFIRSKLVPYFRPKQLKNHTLRVAHTYIAYITEYSPGLKHHCVIFATKAWSQLVNIKVILFLIQWLFRYQNPLKISHFFNLHDWWQISLPPSKCSVKCHTSPNPNPWRAQGRETFRHRHQSQLTSASYGCLLTCITCPYQGLTCVT